jgi:uncharacterized repeat protein (TIGR01451 family)
MLRLYTFLLVVFVYSTTSFVAAQSLQLQVLANKTDILTGETVKFTLFYTCANTTSNCSQVTMVANIPTGIFFPDQSIALTQDISAYTISPDRKTVTFVFVDPLPAGSTGNVEVTGQGVFGLANSTATLSVQLLSGGSVEDTKSINTNLYSHNRFCPYKQKGIGLVLDEPTTYQIDMGYASSNGYSLNGVGTRSATQVSFVDQLPLGAIIDSVSFIESHMPTPFTPLPSNTCVIDNANSKVTCTLPPDYLNVQGFVVPYSVYQVHVRYPSTVFTVGQQVVNSVTVTYTPQGGTPIVVNDGDVSSYLDGSTYGTTFPTTCYPSIEVTDTIIVPSPVLTLNKYLSGGATNIGPGSAGSYVIAANNTGNVALENVVVEDVFPAYLNVHTIEKTPLTMLDNSTVQYWYKSTTNPVYTLVPFTGNIWYVGAQTLTHFKAVIPYMPAGTKPLWGTSWLALHFNLAANAPPSALTNCITATTTTASTNIVSTNACSSVTIDPIANFSELSLYKYILRGPFSIYFPFYVPVQPGDIVWFKLVGINNGGSQPLSNPKLMDLLPMGLDYDGQVLFESPLLAADNTEIIPNYNGTGRTLVRCSWNNPLGTGGQLSMSVKTKVTPLLPGGDPNTVALPGRLYPYVPTPGLKNTGYFTGSSATTCRIPTYETMASVAAVDIYDLDGDGSIVDTICYSTQLALVSSSAAMSSAKWVKGANDAAYTKFPAFANTVPGGMVDYRVVLKNTGNVPMKNIVIVDVLPYLGDQGVVDQADRQSQWKPNLAGPVTSVSGATVYYSIQSNPCRDEMKQPSDPSPFPTGCALANWNTTPPADITKVQALKFDFGATILGIGDSMQFAWPMRAPVNVPTNDEIAWNSFGFIATRQDNNQALLATEAVKVGTKSVDPVAAVYGDRVWFDTGHDGIQDATEGGIDGIKVYLYKQLGGSQNVLTDTRMDSTVTANSGYYLFSNLLPGNYYAVFLKPSVFTLSPANAGAATPATNSDGVATTLNAQPAAITTTKNLAALETDLTWDLGMYCGLIPLVTPIQLVHLGDNVTLTASGGTSYLWNGPNGFTATTASITFNNITSDKIGLYYVNVSSGACYATLETEIRLIDCIAPSGIMMIQSRQTCSGSTPYNNGKLILGGASNANRYFINLGPTSTGTYATALPLPLIGATIQQNIPNAGANYTIRFYNGSNDCFSDETLTGEPVSCDCPAATITINLGSGDPCSVSQVTLSATFSGVLIGCTTQWQRYQGGVWVDIAGATSAIYTTPIIPGITQYRIKIQCSDGCLIYGQ